MESAWHALVSDRSLKLAFLAAGAILILVSGDEHMWRRVLGGSLLVSAQWCP